MQVPAMASGTHLPDLNGTSPQVLTSTAHTVYHVMSPVTVHEVSSILLIFIDKQHVEVDVLATRFGA